MVEGVVDPISHDRFEIPEFIKNMSLIEGLSAEMDLHTAVVTMRVLTGTVVIHEAVAVTKVDFFENFIHKLPKPLASVHNMATSRHKILLR